MLSKFQNASLSLFSFRSLCYDVHFPDSDVGLDLSGLRWKELRRKRWSASLWGTVASPLVSETDLYKCAQASEPEVWAWILLNQRWTRTAACVSSLHWFHLEKHRNERHLFNMSLPLSSKSPTERKLTQTLALAEDQCRGRVVGRHFKQTRPSPEVHKATREEAASAVIAQSGRNNEPESDVSWLTIIKLSMFCRLQTTTSWVLFWRVSVLQCHLFLSSFPFCCPSWVLLASWSPPGPPSPALLPAALTF